MMNLKWKYKLSTSGNQFQLTSGGAAVGLLKDLLMGRVDIVGGGWSGRYSRYKHADFSASTNYVPPECIISIEPPKEIPWFGLVKPFKWYMWMLIMGAVLAVGVTVYAIRKLSRGSDEKTSLQECLWEPTVVICWDAITCRNPPYSVCFLYSCYMLICMLLVGFYMGEYTALVIEPSQLYPPVETFNQLFNRTDLKVLTSTKNWYTRYVSYFPNAPDIENRIEVIERVPGESSVFTILKKLQMNPRKFVYLNTPRAAGYYAYHFSQPGQKKFHYSKESLPPYTVHLFFPKYFPYKEIFNRNIMLMQDVGFVKTNELKHGGPARLVAIDKMKQVEDEGGLLEFKQFIGALVLLSSGYLLALLVLSLEMFYARHI